MTTFNAIPIGMSATDIEALYNSFYTQRLADECRLLSSEIRNLDAGEKKRDLSRRLRIARRLLAKRQLRMFE
jgi:hypothetical protein